MKKILSTIVGIAIIASAAILPVSAITKSDKPITGGNTLFTQSEIMYTGEPTATSAWSNAFCNKEWTGCTWTAAIEDGIDCVKVTPVAGKSTHMMDFNYYQWNNDKYYPSLDCGEYKYLKVKFKVNEAGAKNLGTSHFFASQDSPELGKTLANAEKDLPGFPNTANVWQEAIIDLSDLSFNGTPWSDVTIRQFRYYPFGNGAADADAVCYIEYMGFFKTLAEANAYKGPAAAKAAEQNKAPATVDPIFVTVIIAAASASGAIVFSKKAR